MTTTRIDHMTPEQRAKHQHAMAQATTRFLEAGGEITPIPMGKAVYEQGGPPVLRKNRKIQEGV